MNNLTGPMLCDDRFWQDGQAGPCNIVTFNGEDVRGITFVADDALRHHLIESHNKVVRELLSKSVSPKETCERTVEGKEIFNQDGFPISTPLPGMPVLEKDQPQRIREGTLILLITDSATDVSTAARLLTDKLIDEIGSDVASVVEMGPLYSDNSDSFVLDIAAKRTQLRYLRNDAAVRKGVVFAVFNSSKAHQNLWTQLALEADMVFYLYQGTDNIILEAGKHRTVHTRDKNMAMSLSNTSTLPSPQ